MRAWIHQVGRAPELFCDCGETNNAAHLMAGGCVGQGGRTWEEFWTDPEFGSEVASFLLLSQGREEGGRSKEGGGRRKRNKREEIEKETRGGVTYVCSFSRAGTAGG